MTDRNRSVDILWSQAVRARAGERCQLQRFAGTECAGPLQAHHLLRKRGHSLAARWELSNGVCTCTAHHDAAHTNPLIEASFIHETLGIEAWEELRRRANETVGQKIDRAEVRRELRAYLGDIRATLPDAAR